MHEYKDGVMLINTPHGILRIEDKNDSEYPGVFIEFEATDKTFKHSAKMHIPLTTVEFEPSKGKIQTVVYGDAAQEEYTDLREHENAIGKWTQTDTFQFVKKMSYYDFITIQIVEDSHDDSFAARICRLDLSQFSDDEVQKYIGPFKSVKHIEELYGATSTEIIAGCISQSKLYEAETLSFDSQDSLNEWLQTIDKDLHFNVMNCE